MTRAIGIAGESWELVFAAATAASLARRTPRDTRVLVPETFAHAVADVCDLDLETVAAGGRFMPYREVCDRLSAHAKGGARLVRAGSVFRADDWTPPPHRPPDLPAHRTRRVGCLDVVEVDGGDYYFQGLLALDAPPGRPVWEQYGPQRPVFVFNTNDFDEPRVEQHDTYAILGSGLLGLRMIVHSDPPPGAHVVVYDINAGALAWSRFVLAEAKRTCELDNVIDEFRRDHPGLELRDVLPHERENAERQRAWFREAAPRLAALSHVLSWEYIECDLLRDPRTLLDNIPSSSRLFLMYLDLFVVWHVGGAQPWVEDHRGMARSFERLIREHNGGRVTFLPNERSQRLQVSPGSPFLAGEVIRCT